jgi:hypothetical protein
MLSKSLKLCVNEQKILGKSKQISENVQKTTKNFIKMHKNFHEYAKLQKKIL